LGDEVTAVVLVAGVALRVADAGPPGGVEAEVTCEVVLMIGPAMVACMCMGTLQDAPAARVTFAKAQPEALNKAELPKVPQV
jgi:hypothetical protein